MAQHFKDLIVWQKAMDLVTDVYRITDCFPKREVYSLTDQSAGQRFQFPATSQRVKHTSAKLSSVIFFVIPVAHSLSLRHSY
jgi:hypothetical protein